MTQKQLTKGQASAMPLALGIAFVAFTTQFGGGFASGAQIYSYFIRYGIWCLIFPAITQGLYAFFFWYGMRYSYRHKAFDYRTFSDKNLRQDPLRHVQPPRGLLPDYDLHRLRRGLRHRGSTINSPAEHPLFPVHPLHCRVHLPGDHVRHKGGPQRRLHPQRSDPAGPAGGAGPQHRRASTAPLPTRSIGWREGKCRLPSPSCPTTARPAPWGPPAFDGLFK